MKKAVVVLSGGLDSTILLYKVVKELGSENVFALSFFYGQKQSEELRRAGLSCEKLGVVHKLIDISFLGDVVKNVCANIGGSDVDMPTAEDIKNTTTTPTEVPYRNLILGSISFSFAQANGCSEVYTGLQFGDTQHYWDCKPSYVEALNELSSLNKNAPVEYLAPFSHMTKAEEIKLAEELGVDYSLTLTCYNPDDLGRSCGVCPACGDRLNGFRQAGIKDTVEYQKEINWSL